MKQSALLPLYRPSKKPVSNVCQKFNQKLQGVMLFDTGWPGFRSSFLNRIGVQFCYDTIRESDVVGK